MGGASSTLRKESPTCAELWPTEMALTPAERDEKMSYMMSLYLTACETAHPNPRGGLDLNARWQAQPEQRSSVGQEFDAVVRADLTLLVLELYQPGKNGFVLVPGKRRPDIGTPFLYHGVFYFVWSHENSHPHLLSTLEPRGTRRVQSCDLEYLHIRSPLATNASYLGLDVTAICCIPLVPCSAPLSEPFAGHVRSAITTILGLVAEDIVGASPSLWSLREGMDGFIYSMGNSTFMTEVGNGYYLRTEITSVVTTSVKEERITSLYSLIDYDAKALANDQISLSADREMLLSNFKSRGLSRRHMPLVLGHVLRWEGETQQKTLVQTLQCEMIARTVRDLFYLSQRHKKVASSVNAHIQAAKSDLTRLLKANVFLPRSAPQMFTAVQKKYNLRTDDALFSLDVCPFPESFRHEIARRACELIGAKLSPMGEVLSMEPYVQASNKHNIKGLKEGHKGRLRGLLTKLPTDKALLWRVMALHRGAGVITPQNCQELYENNRSNSLAIGLCLVHGWRTDDMVASCKNITLLARLAHVSWTKKETLSSARTILSKIIAKGGANVRHAMEIAIASNEEEDVEVAVTIFRQRLPPIRDQSNPRFGVREHALDLALCLEALGHGLMRTSGGSGDGFQQAEKVLDMAHASYVSSIDLTALVPIFIHGRINSYHAVGRHDKGVEHAQNLVKTYDEAKALYQAAQARWLLARAWLRRGRLCYSKKFFLESRSIANLIGPPMNEDLVRETERFEASLQGELRFRAVQNIEKAFLHWYTCKPYREALQRVKDAIQPIQLVESDCRRVISTEDEMARRELLMQQVLSNADIVNFEHRIIIWIMQQGEQSSYRTLVEKELHTLQTMLRNIRHAEMLEFVEQQFLEKRPIVLVREEFIGRIGLIVDAQASWFAALQMDEEVDWYALHEEITCILVSEYGRQNIAREELQCRMALTVDASDNWFAVNRQEEEVNWSAVHEWISCPECPKRVELTYMATEASREIPSLRRTIEDLEHTIAEARRALENVRKRVAAEEVWYASQREQENERATKDLTAITRNVAAIAVADPTPRGRPYIVAPEWMPSLSDSASPPRSRGMFHRIEDRHNAFYRMCEALIKARGGLGAVTLVGVDVVSVTPEEIIDFEASLEGLWASTSGLDNLWGGYHNGPILRLFQQTCHTGPTLTMPSHGLHNTLSPPLLLHTFRCGQRADGNTVNLSITKAVQSCVDYRRDSDGAVPVTLVAVALSMGALTPSVVSEAGKSGDIQLVLSGDGVSAHIDMCRMWLI